MELFANFEITVQHCGGLVVRADCSCVLPCLPYKGCGISFFGDDDDPWICVDVTSVNLCISTVKAWEPTVDVTGIWDRKCESTGCEGRCESWVGYAADGDTPVPAIGETWRDLERAGFQVSEFSEKRDWLPERWEELLYELGFPSNFRPRQTRGVVV